MKSSFTLRTRILIVFILLFSLTLVAKLFFIQVIRADTYAEAANRQYATPRGNVFERNTIFFTRKDGGLVSAATQAAGFKVAITPEKILESGEVYKKLFSVIDLDQNDFTTKADKKSDPYEEVAYHLTEEQADKVTALKIPGVSVFKEKWRTYPGGDLASHVLGLIGYQGDTLAGRYGLEQEYEKTLSAEGASPYVNFFAEVFSNIKSHVLDDEGLSGDIVTTIEPTVQDFLEKKLSQVSTRYSTQSVGGIIMDPSDGSIYAMGAMPHFNPNDFSDVKNNSTFTNPLVENVLEFGSIVKPLVMAAALDAGVVNAGTAYNDTGSVVVEKKEIFNFDLKGRGPGTTMQKVLNESLNTGMVFVYHKLGKTNLREYLLSFGIDNKTGIDLPNESAGLVSNILKSPRDIEYANASFGQGIALTPIAMARALASLGNGGFLVHPHVVDKIKYEDGTEKKMTYEKSVVKISPGTGEEITRMLVKVMDEGVRGGAAKNPHYSIAVKTGTAQVADKQSGGYYEDRHTHAFFGYFPAYQPKFIVLLYAVNPRGVRYASETWADPFLDISKFLINYYEVPPDR